MAARAGDREVGRICQGSIWGTGSRRSYGSSLGLPGILRKFSEEIAPCLGSLGNTLSHNRERMNSVDRFKKCSTLAVGILVSTWMTWPLPNSLAQTKVEKGEVESSSPRAISIAHTLGKAVAELGPFT